MPGEDELLTLSVGVSGMNLVGVKAAVTRAEKTGLLSSVCEDTCRGTCMRNSCATLPHSSCMSCICVKRIDRPVVHVMPESHCHLKISLVLRDDWVQMELALRDKGKPSTVAMN